MGKGFVAFHRRGRGAPSPRVGRSGAAPAGAGHCPMRGPKRKARAARRRCVGRAGTGCPTHIRGASRRESRAARAACPTCRATRARSRATAAGNSETT
ncbi:hypothetical protein BSLA_02f1562 [Burkholderia stabilis]|nr:hypothetical protein BSLA_02f1562 [Burkholderia stabilis]